MVGKQTGEWNANEEQYFLQRQVKKINTQQVIRVKPPNSVIGENDIPNDKDDGHQRIGREEIPELFIEPQFGVKRKKKRNDNTTEIYQQI